MKIISFLLFLASAGDGMGQSLFEIVSPDTTQDVEATCSVDHQNDDCIDINFPNKDLVAWGADITAFPSNLVLEVGGPNVQATETFDSGGSFVGFVVDPQNNRVVENIRLCPQHEGATTTPFQLSNLGGATATYSSVMKGDPHIKTWGNKWFDYQGECDLVYVHAPDFENGYDLNIHVRTTIRYGYSYISSAAVQYGKNILEVDSFGTYAFNGVESADLRQVGGLGGYRIHHTTTNDEKHTSRFEIHIAKGQKIVLSHLKDMVSVEIEGASRKQLANASGLMGGLKGELLGRDGVKIFKDDDMNSFGQEWQVHDTEPNLFRTQRSPQYPHELCRLPPSTTTTQEGHNNMKTSVTRTAIRRRKLLGSMPVSFYSNREEWELLSAQYGGVEGVGVTGCNQAGSSNPGTGIFDPNDKCAPVDMSPITTDIRSSCLEHLNAGFTRNGWYWINPQGLDAFKIYCDQQDRDGGWALILHQKDTIPFVEEPDTTNLLCQVGTVSGEQFRAIRDAMDDAVGGLMLRDEHNRHFRVKKDIALAENPDLGGLGVNVCGGLDGWDNLAVNAGGSSGGGHFLFHYEANGCSVTGGDYCLAQVTSISGNPYSTQISRQCDPGGNNIWVEWQSSANWIYPDQTTMWYFLR